MVEPAAFAMRAVELSGIKPTSSALVIGAGAIGLFLLQVLGEFGIDGDTSLLASRWQLIWDVSPSIPRIQVSVPYCAGRPVVTELMSPSMLWGVGRLVAHV